MKKQTLETFFKLFFALVIFIVFVGIFMTISEGIKVGKDEFGPKIALVKYEWFKDASFQLDAKIQNLKTYKQRIDNMEESYSLISRNKWNRTDSDTYNQWITEYSGISANYNNLVAEYNSNSNKFNWKIFETENNEKLQKFYIKK
jgi:hypothetical protein